MDITETGPCIHRCMFYDKSGFAEEWVIDSSIRISYWNKWKAIWKKEFDLYLITYTKIDSNTDHKSKWEKQINKTSERYYTWIFCDFRVDNDLTNHKALIINEKIDKWNCLKIKNFGYYF